MKDQVDLLFLELADLPPDERERVFSERRVSLEVRAEVESLLRFDGPGGHPLTEGVQSAAKAAALPSPAADCGPYRLVKLLGFGGMGEVYLAERSDGEIRQQAAIKFLRTGAEGTAWHDRFLHERHLLASLNHPAIAGVLNAGHTSDGRPYLVLEYVDGMPIDSWCEGKDLRTVLTLLVRVCEAVAYAHRRLIIHRDLKPSNILVDSSGQPKLLDFGIAKLLDGTAERTQTVERMLTPTYASPEQLRGDAQTTATDIYSLGAVLYKLVANRPPHEPGQFAPETIEPASRWNRAIPGDVDAILRKALRGEPEERYASVEAFAEDIRAFLDSRPVQARSGDAWYRTRKLVRRHWIPVTAAVITIAGLSIGLVVANRERALAQRRFDQVRRLASKVLALDTFVSKLPGATKARHEIIAMSKEYLESLAPEARDPELALELGRTYYTIATAEGLPGHQNLGRTEEAERSLRRAAAMIEPVLSNARLRSSALFPLAGIHTSRMILAAKAGNREREAVEQAQVAVRYLDELLAAPEGADLSVVAMMLHNIALTHRNLHLNREAIGYARRHVAVARSVPGEEHRANSGLSLLAQLLRDTGDFEGALQAAREARANLDKTVFPSEINRRQQTFVVYWRQGVLLGGGGGLNLSRPDEAIEVLQHAMDGIEEWARLDPDDAGVRLLFGSASRELGPLLTGRDPKRALAVYDLAIRRSAEVRNNAVIRRNEAEALAGSSYPLRRLNRVQEAKARIERALDLLRGTKNYPVASIRTDDAVEPTLRALADHHAATGYPRLAAEVYQELLDKIMAAKPDPANDLRQANKISRIYEALAVLYRRTGRPERAAPLSSARLELWRQWKSKLPQNPYVERQLQAASSE